MVSSQEGLEAAPAEHQIELYAGRVMELLFNGVTTPNFDCVELSDVDGALYVSWKDNFEEEASDTLVGFLEHVANGPNSKIEAGDDIRARAIAHAHDLIEAKLTELAGEGF